MLPERFLYRMRLLLKDDYLQFEKSLTENSVRGFRVNQIKTTVDKFLSIYSSELEALPYASDGYIPKDTDGVGQTPEHHSGMIYVQDPGAMATVNALDIPAGIRVLDACAAPGGKSSQLAARIGEKGALYSNEYVQKRAKIIVGNFERLGIRNAVVTSLDTATLKDMFLGYFDLVLCDAPCSGEGMFRKNDNAAEQWSEENVLSCAKRQSEILENLSTTVASGGYLLYSTCTYSLEENELVVGKFLKKHSDYSLVKVKDELIKATAPGIVPSGYEGLNLELSRRFYPHISKGEGQYIALMKREENTDILPTILYKEEAKALTKREEAIVRKFFFENMHSSPSGRLIKQGGGIAIVPDSIIIPNRSVFMAGVMVGEIRNGILFPHHQLFSAYGNCFIRRCQLNQKDSRTLKYLRGEEIEVDEIEGGGYSAVIYEGSPLGGGKISGGRLKNHYPKGLRNTR